MTTGSKDAAAVPTGDGGAGSSSTVRRHEFWVSDAEEDAIRKTKIILKRVGELTEVSPGSHVAGAIKFGLINAHLRVGWRAESEAASAAKALDVGTVRSPDARRALLGASMGVTLILEADCPGARDASTRDAASRSAIERFEEAYHHFDDADYKPDRLGLLPMTIFGVIIFLILVGVLLMRTSFVQRLLPKHAITISATNATPEASPSTAPSADPNDPTGYRPDGQ